MAKKFTKWLKDTGEGLLGLYMLGCTVLVTGALHHKYVKPIYSPAMVEDVLFVGDQRHYRHYDYGNRSVYRQNNRDGMGLVELLDKDNDGIPDIKRTYISSRFLPMIQTELNNNSNNWQIQQTWKVDKQFW